jgi:hypothetical protein
MSELTIQATEHELFIAYLHLGGLDSVIDRLAIARTDDGKAAWLAADIRFVGDCGGPGCGVTLDRAHLTAVYERDQDGWAPVVWNIATTVSADRHADAVKAGTTLDPIPSNIDGADAAVKVFQSTIGDPKALAQTVSDRKDVVLYGSEDGERFTGAAQVKAQLASWRLAFKVHDGVRAGLTANGNVAWVAANVDATPSSKPKAKPMPYRALFVYEHRGDRWMLVQAQFSFGRS